MHCKQANILIQILMILCKLPNLIDTILSKVNNDDDTKTESNEINLDNPLFKNKKFRILMCGMGYPYILNRVSYMQKLGYSNLTLLPQCATNKEAEKLLHKHIVTEKKNEYDAIINCWLGAADAIKNETKLPNCKVFSCVSSGFKESDLNYCKANGIYLTNAPLALDKCTADLVVGLMLATCRQFYHRTKVLKNGQLQKQKKTFYNQCGDINNLSCANTENPLSKDLYNSTVGIIGLGRIGREISKRLHFGFDCNVIYFNGADKKRKEYDTKYGAKHCDSFDALLKMSDFVVAMCPLNKSTKHLFDKTAFEKMKNNAIFINACRGAVCNTDDLVCALKNGQIMAAGLDVTDPEPLPSDHELFKLDNATVLPHIGAATVETRERILNMAIDNTLRVLNDVSCQNIVYSPGLASSYTQPMALTRHEWGWIYEWECSDPDCWSGCTATYKRQVHFGYCYSMEGCPNQSIMFACNGHLPAMIQGRWNNPHCQGVPIEQVNTMTCYGKPFGFGTYECGLIKRKPEKWYKYRCMLPHQLGEVPGEVREEGVSDIVIAVAVLLFVCLIGIIIGYLFRQRKKKRSAEKKSLLCEAGSADS